MTDSLKHWKTNRRDYFAVDLGEAGQPQVCCLKNWRQGELGDPFWWSPSPLDIPNPPLTWLKPVTQRAILDKHDLMVKITRANRDAAWQQRSRFGRETEEGQQIIQADAAWRHALAERFWAYSDLGLERPEE